eukprot:3811296-Rhodomonas_salina.1
MAVSGTVSMSITYAKNTDKPCARFTGMLYSRILTRLSHTRRPSCTASTIVAKLSSASTCVAEHASRMSGRGIRGLLQVKSDDDKATGLCHAQRREEKTQRRAAEKERQRTTRRGQHAARSEERGARREKREEGGRTILAASLDTSVPVMPIATPMLAALSAGASLTPSPVIDVICGSASVVSRGRRKWWEGRKERGRKEGREERDGERREERDRGREGGEPEKERREGERRRKKG